tara:strand:- start:47 stop:481 length:435 start_codon:yes stop_codon:yes gene_type:complete
MFKIILTIILSLFATSSFSLTLKSSDSVSETTKILEKGLMEVTNESSGEVSYKILWTTPDGSDTFWIRAVKSGSDKAFTGEVDLIIPDSAPLESIQQSYSIGVFVATEEGMDRAVRAIEDVYRAENAHKGGGTGSSSSSSSGSC